jgi:hypothetical protein
MAITTPTANDSQKLQHIQQEDNLDKNLLLRYIRSSKFLTSTMSALNSSLARVILRGETNHRSKKLHTVHNPRKYNIISVNMSVVG